MKTALPALALALAAGASAGQDMRLPFHDGTDGISSAFFDAGLGWRWPQGRVVAAVGAPSVVYQMSSRVARIDVTGFTGAWLDGSRPDDGLLLRLERGSAISFHAREATDFGLRPQLLVILRSGRKLYLEAVADAALDTTSIRGLGTLPVLTLKGSSPLTLRFDLGRLRGSAAADLESATLILVRSDAAGPATATLSVAPLAAPTAAAAPPEATGLAQRYPRDQGILRDPDVLFADGFDNGRRSGDWVPGGPAEGTVVDHADAATGPLLSGPALCLTVRRGQQLGLDLRWRFRSRGAEPDEAYFRYYLLLAPDWLRASEGGKLPGLAGTYGLAGWGGRPWDGYKGWSLRGAYLTTPKPSHPAHGRIPIGTYAYHSRSDRYGEWLGWPLGGKASLIEPGRWAAIEQHVKLNTPGREDGRLRVWVDGRLAQDLGGLRLRDAPDIHIQELWLDVFHGGTSAPTTDLHACVDQIVVARRYIGPMEPR